MLLDRCTGRSNVWGHQGHVQLEFDPYVQLPATQSSRAFAPCWFGSICPSTCLSSRFAVPVSDFLGPIKLSLAREGTPAEAHFPLANDALCLGMQGVVAGFPVHLF